MIVSNRVETKMQQNTHNIRGKIERERKLANKIKYKLDSEFV